MKYTIKEEGNEITFNESINYRIELPGLLLLSAMIFTFFLGGGWVLKLDLLQNLTPILLIIYTPMFFLLLTLENITKVNLTEGTIEHTKKSFLILKWTRRLKREDIKHIMTEEEVKEEMDSHHSAIITIRSKKNLSIPIIGGSYVISLFKVEEGELLAGKEWIEWLGLLHETFQWSREDYLGDR